MKKILSAALLLASLSINAQETYQNAELETQDLNGDARYVGMGGAMEALGANLSAASDNPASMGLFRGSSVSVSFGMSSHKNIGNVPADSKSVVNFDQAGFVSNMRIGYNSYVNWGINYHKSTNFNQILTAASRGLQYGEITRKNDKGEVISTYPVYGSQNGITYEKGGDVVDSQVDKMYLGLIGDCQLSSGDNYLSRERKGYIGNYDLTVSGNHQDRIYWGVGFTLSNVNYKNATYYKENIIDLGEPNGNISIDDVHEITGVGVNLKGGVIFRPIEANPFRIGLSVETPTWYDLSSHSEAVGQSTVYINDGDFQITPGNGKTRCDYDFEISTPWKFGLTAGTTFGKSLAIGASFNYADYSSSKSKIKDGDSYDWWTNTYYSNSHNDEAMNNHTSASLKGVSTFKVGAEYRVIPEVAVRIGYNYVSPMYKKDAVRNMFIESPGTEVSSTTDFTNWNATNRYTCGVGFNLDHFYVDLAYQYNTVSGTYLPYQNCSDVILDCNVTPSQSVDVTSKRHQAICTIGYRF